MSKARLVITAVVFEKRPVREVVAEYGVSRSWVYELLARYRDEGEIAFEPRSKRPLNSTPGPQRSVGTSNWRVRHDRIDLGGKITLRHHGHMFKIGIGRPHARTRVVCLIKDLEIRIIHATTGEILRTLTLDTTRTYQPTGKPEGGPKGPRKPKHPNP